MPHTKNINITGRVVDLLGQPIEVGDFVVFGKTGTKTVVGQITKLTPKESFAYRAVTPTEYVNVTVSPIIQGYHYNGTSTRTDRSADRQVGVAASRVVRIDRSALAHLEN